MFLLNSCLGHFSAASLRWHPFSRTYGVNLPSSLTMLLPLVLGSSPHPPVSVYGTGRLNLNSSFSRQCGLITFGTLFPSSSQIAVADIFYLPTNSLLERTLPAVRVTILLCPCFSQTIQSSTGISTCCPSTTPCGLALGPD